MQRLRKQALILQRHLEGEIAPEAHRRYPAFVGG